jgi:hypothetical protein
MSITWKRRFVFGAVAFFWIAFLVSMCSCGQKAWTKRGYNKGWIDTTAVRDSIFIPADTVIIDSAAESFILILDTLLQDTCINKANRAKLKSIIKKDFIPAAQKVYKDTVITGNDGNRYSIRFTPAGIKITADIKKQEIKEAPCDPWYSDWPYWLIIAILFLLLWLTRRK